MVELRQYIGGRLVPGEGELVRIVNPGTEETAGTLRWASANQAVAALEAARDAFHVWSRLSLNERGRWLERLVQVIEQRKDECLDLLMAESGKLVGDAEGDFGMLVDCLRYFPEEARRLAGEVLPDWDGNFCHLVIRQPLGVIVGYLAWNFPLLNLGFKIGPALSAGCTLVLKPSSYTPLASLFIGQIASEIGFPAGVLNIIAGPASEIANVMSSSSIPRLITMIGSTASGREVIGASICSIKRFSLELGGNAPAIVLADADVTNAVEKLVSLKFVNAGQVCIAPNRVFVHRSIHDQFVSEAGQRAARITLGWGKQEGAGMGPLISRQVVERMVGLVKDAVAHGANLVCGGESPAGKGYFFPATILDGVTPSMQVFREEIFGPIMPIIAFSDVDEVIAQANDTEYGLASYLFTNDLACAMKIAEALESGTVCVNEPVYSYHLPHGGTKESGIGKDCSHLSLEEYYYMKRISIRR